VADRARHRTQLTFAVVIISTISVLGWLAALEVAPRFQEEFGTNVCSDSVLDLRTCADAKVRDIAIPVGAFAIAALPVAATFTAFEARSRGRAALAFAVWATYGVLVGIYISYVISPTTTPGHFVGAAGTWPVFVLLVNRAAGGGWLRSVFFAVLAPWPFLVFAFAYPVPR
jgi:hypothetical protein